ncbi:MAG TPA: hypothetical protein VFP98_10445 [Candidatus Polarisedimenticolia bacterium]|nr:hypothetical protein [Candidatus Polarisedimenticolia bacterium]
MTKIRSLKHRHAAMMALILAAPAAFPGPAAAAGRGDYTMELIVDGVPAREFAARGTTYVEAIEGRAYSIRLRNNTGRRVAIALSVDGLNTIDAKRTSARDAARWILEPYRTLTLDGWQTSASTARRFFFTTEPESYGAWLGRTRDLGVISAVVFREREYYARSAPQVGGQSAAPGSPSETENRSESNDKLSMDSAATGIGEEVGHDVTRIRFDAEPKPAAVLNIRYEFRDGLVRLGVLPRPGGPCVDPIDRRERARGFEEMDFAPDPYCPR